MTYWLVLSLGACAIANEPVAPQPVSPPTNESADVSSDPQRDAYQRWLEANGGDPAQITKGTPLGHANGPYAFFYASAAPGHKTHAAAVSAEGAIVASDSEHGEWLDYLGTTSPDEAHAQIGFLNGSWATLVPDTPSATMVLRRFPDAEPLLTPPTIDGDDSERTFTGWYFQPPEMLPFRVTLRATPTTAQTSNHSVEQVAAEP